MFLGLIEMWSAMYSKEEKNGSYHLIGDGEEKSFNLNIEHTQAGMTDLLKKQMQEFNMSREPIILPPMKINTEQEISSKSIYFFNIGKFGFEF